MVVQVAATPPPIGRPRDPAIESAILRATQDLIIEHGFAGMTVEAVVKAAGSGKAAVYRRWPTKTALVIAAVQGLHRAAVVPDTGSLRGDLLECALHFARAGDRADLVMSSLLREAVSEPALRLATYNVIGRPPAVAMATVLHRWRDRGAIADSVPIELMAGIIPAMAFRAAVMQRESLTVPMVTSLVDHVLMPALNTEV